MAQRGRPKGGQKYGGRQKGTPNKLTSDLRGFITQLLEDNRKQIIKDLKSDELSPKERLTILEKFMQYVIPKQQAHTAAIDISQITEDQLNQVINEITDEIGL